MQEWGISPWALPESILMQGSNGIGDALLNTALTRFYISFDQIYSQGLVECMKSTEGRTQQHTGTNRV